MTTGVSIDIRVIAHIGLQLVPVPCNIVYEKREREGSSTSFRIELSETTIQRLSDLLEPKKGVALFLEGTNQKRGTILPPPPEKVTAINKFGLVSRFFSDDEQADGVPPELVPIIKKEVLVLLTVPGLTDDAIKDIILDNADLGKVKAIRETYTNAIRAMSNNASCPSCELGRINRVFMGKLMQYVYPKYQLQAMVDSVNALNRLTDEQIDAVIRTDALKVISKHFNAEVTERENSTGGCTQCAMNAIKRKYSDQIKSVLNTILHPTDATPSKPKI